MSKVFPTVQEIVSTLKRSNIPTIVIEGPDDVYIYRYLKSKLSTKVVSIQPCGGRNTLFKIHDRKEEFQDRNVIFIADKDAYRFYGIPVERSDIIFTEGYCIENDVYEGSNIHNFIDDEDQLKLDLLRNIILRWYAFELEKHRELGNINDSLKVASHIDRVSPKNINDICPDFCHSIGFTEPKSETIDELLNEYNLNIRGKQLFQMLSRFLSKKERFSSFTDKNLVEIALKQQDNIVLDKISDQLTNRLNLV